MALPKFHDMNVLLLEKGKHPRGRVPRGLGTWADGGHFDDGLHKNPKRGLLEDASETPNRPRGRLSQLRGDGHSMLLRTTVIDFGLPIALPLPSTSPITRPCLRSLDEDA